MTRRRFTPSVAAVVLPTSLVAMLAACGPDHTVAGVEAVDVGTADAPPADTLRGDRFCEVSALIFDAERRVVGIEVWSTYGLGDCPSAAWESVDPVSVGATLGAAIVELDGPRFWLADEAEGVVPADAELRELDGLEMHRIAALTMSAGDPEPAPYVAEAVRRSGRYTYAAGTGIFELTAPDGTVYVMLSWGRSVDPTLTAVDLPQLGERLSLPEGWSYAMRTLDTSLTVTAGAEGSTIEDALGSKYVWRAVTHP